MGKIIASFFCYILWLPILVFITLRDVRRIRNEYITRRKAYQKWNIQSSTKKYKSTEYLSSCHSFHNIMYVKSAHIVIMASETLVVFFNLPLFMNQLLNVNWPPIICPLRPLPLHPPPFTYIYSIQTTHSFNNYFSLKIVSSMKKHVGDFTMYLCNPETNKLMYNVHTYYIYCHS